MTGVLASLAAPASAASSGGGGGGTPTPPAGAITISNQFISWFSTSGSTITVSYVVQNDGTIRNHNGTSLETWNSASGSVGSYEVRFTLSSGDTPTGALGIWQGLGTTRTISLTSTSGFAKECTISVEIRDVATQTLQDSAQVTLTAESSEGGGFR